MVRIPLPWRLGNPDVRHTNLAPQDSEASLNDGADITIQEAVDLLHKLREESFQVQAIYARAGGVSSILRGTVRSPIDDESWSIASQDETMGSALSFDLSLATVRKFGDESAVSGSATFPFRFRFTSVLSFSFGDGSTLLLFEFDQNRTTGYR